MNTISYKNICDDFKNISNIVNQEKLNICVISYGGSCSNILGDTLKKNGYVYETKIWNKILCHCPEYIELDIPIIYIYDNPIKSFLSMKKRGKGIWDVNQTKLSNNYNIELSDENLLKFMIKQYNVWSKATNILIIRANELFTNDILDKLKLFLKNDKLKHFPIKYIEPATNSYTINSNEYELFKKYQNEIEEIDKNSFNINIIKTYLDTVKN